MTDTLQPIFRDYQKALKQHIELLNEVHQEVKERFRVIRAIESIIQKQRERKTENNSHEIEEKEENHPEEAEKSLFLQSTSAARSIEVTSPRVPILLNKKTCSGSPNSHDCEEPLSVQPHSPFGQPLDSLPPVLAMSLLDSQTEKKVAGCSPMSEGCRTNLHAIHAQKNPNVASVSSTSLTCHQRTNPGSLSHSPLTPLKCSGSGGGNHFISPTPYPTMVVETHSSVRRNSEGDKTSRTAKRTKLTTTTTATSPLSSPICSSQTFNGSSIVSEASSHLQRLPIGSASPSSADLPQAVFYGNPESSSSSAVIGYPIDLSEDFGQLIESSSECPIKSPRMEPVQNSQLWSKLKQSSIPLQRDQTLGVTSPDLQGAPRCEEWTLPGSSRNRNPNGSGQGVQSSAQEISELSILPAHTSAVAVVKEPLEMKGLPKQTHSSAVGAFQVKCHSHKPHSPQPALYGSSQAHGWCHVAPTMQGVGVNNTYEARTLEEYVARASNPASYEYQSVSATLIPSLPHMLQSSSQSRPPTSAYNHPYYSQSCSFPHPYQPLDPPRRQTSTDLGRGMSLLCHSQTPILSKSADLPYLSFQSQTAPRLNGFLPISTPPPSSPALQLFSEQC